MVAKTPFLLVNQKPTTKPGYIKESPPVAFHPGNIVLKIDAALLQSLAALLFPQGTDAVFCFPQNWSCSNELYGSSPDPDRRQPRIYPHWM